MLGWVWGLVGLVLGALGMFFALKQVRGSAAAASTGTTQLTTGWRLREFGRPIIVARDVSGVAVPDGARILTSGRVDPELVQQCEVRHVPQVRCEFALDLDRRKAALFTAGVTEGASAVVTTDPSMLARLEAEWRTLADRATGYVERVPIAELAGRAGVMVETQGLVQDVLPYKDRFMIRLEDTGHIIGVVVEKDPAALQDERILVSGPLDRDGSGYPFIVAEDIRRVR